jgi:hypothetical protein
MIIIVPLFLYLDELDLLVMQFELVIGFKQKGSASDFTCEAMLVPVGRVIPCLNGQEGRLLLQRNPK